MDQMPPSGSGRAFTGERRTRFFSRFAKLFAMMRSLDSLGVVDVVKDLVAIANQTCAVYEGANRLGTGFLIGKDGSGDLVITCQHVVDDASDILNVTFVFNNIVLSGPNGGSRVAKVASATPLLSGPVYNGTGEPAAGDLDFCVLSLDAKVGQDTVGNAARGTIQVPPLNQPIPLDPGFVQLIGYPGQQGVSFAGGDLTGLRQAQTRFLHDAFSASGDSGSPVFNADMKLIGLNCGPVNAKANPPLNDAIDFQQIHDLADKANIDL